MVGHELLTRVVSLNETQSKFVDLTGVVHERLWYMILTLVHDLPINCGNPGMDRCGKSR